MKTLTGKNYWCGVSGEHVHFRKCSDSLGDLITNADHIRSMSDEELGEFLSGKWFEFIKSEINNPHSQALFTTKDKTMQFLQMESKDI